MTAKKKNMRRWTWKRVHEAVERNLQGWEIIQEEPERVTGGMKLKLKCPEDHGNIKYPNNIERGVRLGCRQCIKTEQAHVTYNKYIEILEAEQWEMISKVDELIESDKSPSLTSLRVKCPNGKESTKTYGSFSNGSRCICCRPKRKYKRWSLEDAREEYEKRGFIFKGNEWKTTQEKYKTECGTCEYEWRPSFSNIIHGNTGCPKCSGHYQSLETLTEWTQQNRPEFEIIQSQEYINAHAPLLVKCLKHGEVNETTAHEFKNLGRNSCKSCNHERRTNAMIEINSQYEMNDRTGSNSPVWTGLTPLARHLRSRIGDWRTTSFEANDYTCQLSKIRGGSLEVHHVSPFNSLLRWTMNITKLPIYQSVGEYSEEQLQEIETTFLKLHDIYGKGILLTKEIHDGYHNQVGRHDGFINIDTFIMFVKSYAHENNVNLTQLIHELQEQKRINEMVAVNYSFQSA